MKKLIAGITFTIIFATTAHAGIGNQLDSVVVAVDQGDGTTVVEGNMTAVRFSEDDVQSIGCSVRNHPSGSPLVVCNANDLDSNSYFCFSFDSAIADALQSVSPYSWLQYQYDNVTNERIRLVVSVRSHHIPSAATEKSKDK